MTTHRGGNDLSPNKRQASERIRECRAVRWIDSPIGHLALGAVVIVVSVLFAVGILLSAYETEQEAQAQPAIGDEQVLSILESIQRSMSATADIAEATYRSYDELHDALEELMVMNAVFMEWAEQQGLVTKVPYEQEEKEEKK